MIALPVGQRLLFLLSYSACVVLGDLGTFGASYILPTLQPLQPETIGENQSQLFSYDALAKHAKFIIT